MESEPELIVHQHPGWGEIVLNRPARRNAITGPLIEALANAVTTFNEDENVHLIMLRGAGGAFCSGLDIKEFNAVPEPPWLANYGTLWRNTHRAFYNSQTPIVGVLERCAINAGAALALACDLLIVGEESFLQIGEVQQGIGVVYNVGWLARRHSEAVCARLTLTGERVYGAELVRLGIAYQCAPEDELKATVDEFVTRLTGFTGGGLVNVKRTMRAMYPTPADEWFDQAASANPSVTPKPKPVHR